MRSADNLTTFMCLISGNSLSLELLLQLRYAELCIGRPLPFSSWLVSFSWPVQLFFLNLWIWVKQKSLCFLSGDRSVHPSLAVCWNFTSPRDFPQQQTPLFLHSEQQGHIFRTNNIRLCLMILVVPTGEWQVPTAYWTVSNLRPC